MRECYTSKILAKPPCLISKIKIGKICTVKETINRRVVRFIVSLTVQIFSNFIFAIKQGGLDKTFDV